MFTKHTVSIYSEVIFVQENIMTQQSLRLVFEVCIIIFLATAFVHL